MNKRYGWLLSAGSILSKLSVALVFLFALSPASAQAQTNGNCFRPPTGLTGWWPLDGNSDPLIGLSPGIPIGNPFFIAGQVGAGLFFDGSDDGLLIQSAPRPGTVGFTAECWIWPWSFGSHQPILAWISPDGQPSVTLALGDPQHGQNDSLWTGFRALDGITRSFIIPSGLVVTGVWQHVALVYTRGASNAAVYLNGSFVGSGFVGTPLFQSAQIHALRVANYSGTNGPLPSGYYGGIDEITFYDRILTSNQIASIFLAGAAGKCKHMLPPVIVAQPQNQSVPPGGTALFSVTAQGTEPLLYRWRRNGITLSNSPNAPTLVLSNVSVANLGAYSVLITNAFGSSISSNAQLALVTNSLPPTIVSFGPSNLTVQAGGNAQFTVVASGSPPLSYRWEFNGVTIPGRTNSSLLLSAVTPAQSGSYQCFVSNPAGTTASPVASLTVTDGPVDLPVIVTQPQDQSVPQGGNAFFNVVATGTPPLSYQWHFLGAPIPGATSNFLAVLDVQSNQAGSYYVVVANTSGSVTSSVALLNLVLPPTILAQPQSRSTPVGSTVGFSLGIGGTPPFAIQWFFNGAALPGATNNPLILANVTSAQAGTYLAHVANAAGETFSSNAVLTVFSCQRLTAPYSYSSWWPFDGNADDIAKTNFGILLGNPSFSSGFVGQALELDGVDDSVLIPASPTLVAANVGTTNDGFTIEGWIQPAEVTRPQPIFAWQGPLGEAGPQLWLVGSQGGSPGGLTAEFLDGGGQLQVISTPGGLIQAGTWQHVALAYHRFSLSAIYVNGNSVTQRFVASSISQTMPPYQLRLGGLDGGPSFGGGLDEVQIFGRVLTPAQINAIYVAGDSGKCKDALPPTMIVHPAPQTVNAGDSVTLRAFAKGTDPLVYRWRRSGVTFGFGPELFIPSASISNAGIYSVVVSNSFGFVTSSNAALTVITPSNSSPPSITSLFPLSQTVTQGSTATFTVVASGAGPLSYQWLFNGIVMTGRVSSVLSLVGVEPSQTGGYSVVVANSGGSVTSSVATLTVVPSSSFGQLVSFDSIWKYDDTGADLGTAWRSPAYNDAAWPSGPGLLGIETSIPFPYPVPILTPLSRGTNSLTTNHLTSYFRTTFNFSGDPSAVSLVSTSFVDDGAVFFLNGSEVARLRVPLGQTFNTPASAGPAVEGTPEVSIFATANLVNGLNTLAVEVHQNSVFSSDIVFGMNLTATTGAPPPSSAPIIVVEPQSRIVALGSTTSFSVIATGAPPLLYQWHFNGSLLPGRTNSVLTLTNVGTNSAGNYFAVVRNPFGSATSGVATLTIAVAPPPAGEELVAFNSVWKYNDTGADLGTAWRESAYNDSAWPSGPGLLGVETFPYPVPLLTPLSLGTNSVITYYFRTTFNFSGNPSAVSLVSTSFVDDGAVFFLNGSEVARLRVPAGQTFNTPASAGPTVEGTPEVASFATTSLVNGLNTLAVEVHQTSVASSDIVFGMNLIATTNTPPPPGAPIIVVQPQSRTVAIGSTTSFSVIATGAPPLSYQWHFNGNPVPGGTSNTLTLVNVGSNSVGSYFAVVSNPFGSATSSMATLTVTPPATNTAPRIVSPTIVVISNMMVGSAATFRVVASGSTPLSYQWYRNGTPISGANGDTLLLSNIQLAQAGTYFAIVANPFGTVTNRGFVLNVNDGQPGGVINFSLLASSNAVVFETSTNLVPVGPKYLAQLYAGLTPDNLQPIGAAVPFNVPGRFSGGTRTITFISSEVPIPVQVRVWESAKGPTFEEALANRGRVGQSAIVQIIPRFVPNPPAQLTGLTSFTLSFAPSVTGQSLTVNQGGSLPIVLIATDPDGDPLSFTVTPPSHGSLSGTPPSVTYTPAECHVGSDSFTFTASDGTFASSATVNILVTPSQAPPVASFTVSPLAVLSGNQTDQLIISPNNSNALVVLDASVSLALNCGPLVLQWFAAEFPIVPFDTGPVVTNEFLTGSHSVLLALTTAQNATATASTSFEIITAAEAVQTIIDQVVASALPRNVKHPLLATLGASVTNFEQGDFNTAVSQLHAFCNKVRSQIAPSDPALAETLISACRSIESVFEH